MAKYQEVEVRFNKSPNEEFPVGILAEKDSRLYFEYDSGWLTRGLQLSPFFLPLQAGLAQHKAHSFGPIFGLFDDSLPDGWGLLLMDRAFRSRNIQPAAIPILDRFLYLGTRTMGALTYHPPTDRQRSSSPAINLQNLAEEARLVYAGKSTDILPQLMRAGGSPGGARPKILVGFNPVENDMLSGEDDLPEGFEHWMVKFSARTETVHEGKVEYGYSLMAGAAGIEMPETRLFLSGTEDQFFGVKRFDRQAANLRCHIHSFAGLIQANFRIPSCDYGDLFKATSLLTRNYLDLERVYRLMVFNILSHNRDDHAKNFSFLLDDSSGKWEVSPAYDLTFSHGPGGEHSTTVAGEGLQPTRKQCIDLAVRYDLSAGRATSIFAEIVDAVSRWPEFAQSAGLDEEAMEQIGRFHREF
jgi:serine/threonine-protein kinase HipA